MQSKLVLLHDIYRSSGISPENIAYYVDQYLFPEDVNGMNLLDVGGADGSIALWLQLQHGAKVDILDEYAGHGSAATNRDLLCERLRFLNLPEVQVIAADFRHAAMIPSNTYDAIYTRNCLHHVFRRGRSRDQDVVEAMKLFHKWMKPGGHLVIGEVGWLLSWRLIPPLQRKLFPNIVYSSKSSFRRWRDCAQIAGFSFLRVKWYVPYKLRSVRFLLGSEFTNIFLTGAYVLHMKKPHTSND